MQTSRQALPFYWVDVFAVEPLTGNPLAVVEGGEHLPLDLLRRIAREFNQSETTFVMRPTRKEADWRLRSFTAAGAEVFGAGHNALGAWWWLADAGKLSLTSDVSWFHQEIGDRVLPVSVSAEGGVPSRIVMDQEAPQMRGKLADTGDLARSLGLTLEDLAVDRMPCQVVFTGAAHLMVPIRDRDTVDRIQPNAPALLEILRRIGAEGCYVFSLDARHPGATAYSRFFNPTVGIWEDPATGTAAGPLAAHLVAHGIARMEQVQIIEQGTALGRTSLIQAEVLSNKVRIAGRGVVVASGTLSL